MTFFPVLERELLVVARHRASYWMRSAVGLVAVTLCVPPLLSVSSLYSTTMIGKGVFDSAMTSAFLVTCSSCLLTAASVANERQEGTLGLLFHTRVGSFDVVLGKLGSLGLLGLCALIAFLPVLMIPVLAGGVTGGEAFRKGLALMGNLLLALGAGLWSAAQDRKGTKGLLRAALMMALLVLMPFLIQALTPFAAQKLPTVGLFSPLTALVRAGDYEYRSDPAPFWLSLIAIILLAWWLIIRAGMHLQRTVCIASEKTTASANSVARDRWRGGSADGGPIQWLVQRQRGLRGALWLAALLSFTNRLWWFLFPRFWAGAGLSGVWLMQTPGMAAGLLVTGLFAWASSRFFIDARRAGALELLMTTPVGAGSIVSAHWKVLRLLLVGPLLVMLVPGLLQIFVYVGMWGNGRFAPPAWAALNAAFSCLGLANTVFGLSAACWLGIWLGLRSRGYAGVITWSLLLANGVPFLISISGRLLLSFFTPVLSGFRSGVATPFISTYLLVSWVPQLVTLVYLVILTIWTWRQALGKQSYSDLDAFNLRVAISESRREAATALRRVRHWTPGSEVSEPEPQNPFPK